jgi:hypothetical protein
MITNKAAGWRTVLYVTSVIACLASTSARAGQLVGINPLPSPGPYTGNNDNEDMIMVGSPSDPVAITLDPNGTAWTKQFVINRDGQGWSTTGPQSMVTVMETLVFPPSSTLRPSDWHETIVPTPGDGGSFKWAGGSILIGTASYPGTTSADGKEIWFEFPPIPPTAPPVKITKNLMWAGGVITPGPIGQNNYVVTVREQPSIPEPATLALLSLAALAAAAVRTRS